MNAGVPLESNHGLLEPIHGVVEPIHGVVEPIHGVVEPIHGLVEPIHGLVEPIHGLVEPIHGLVEPIHGLVESIHGLAEPIHGLVESADLPVLAVPVSSMAGVGTENASLAPAIVSIQRARRTAYRVIRVTRRGPQRLSTTACYRPKRSHPRRRMGSGGSRGLQNRCFGAEASKGWFDSDAPPPGWAGTAAALAALGSSSTANVS